MQRFFREHLQRALRHFSISVVGILLAPVGLSLIGDDNLNMPFGAQRAALQQGHFVLHTPAIHIPTRLYIVQCVSHYRKLLEETVIESLFCSSADLLQPSFYSTL